MSCLSICMFNIDCTAEIKYVSIYLENYLNIETLICKNISFIGLIIVTDFQDFILAQFW